jgi:hypothetical protein
MLLGACAAGLSSEAHAYVQRVVNSFPGLVPPLRLCFRVGVIATLLGVGFVLPGRRLGGALVDLGRASLRVYWFHLPFAYGVLGRPLRGRLDYMEFALGAPLLLLAMWGLSRVRFGPRPGPRLQAASAPWPSQDRA